MGDEDYARKSNEEYSFPMRVLRPIDEGGEQIINYKLNVLILKRIDD